jgi:Trk-type K+ transport system membrane component
MANRPVVRFGERRLQRAFETGRILPFLVLSITVLVVGFGVLMWLVDREDFPSLGLALWWATSTVTTVGSSNGAWLHKRIPHLPESRSGWPRSSASFGAD